MIHHIIIVEDERENYELAFNYKILEDIGPELIVNHEHHPCYEMCFQRSKEVSDPTHT